MNHKQIQFIGTITISNDLYSQLLNKSMDLESIVYNTLEDGGDNLSFDFPAVIIEKLVTDE